MPSQLTKLNPDQVSAWDMLTNEENFKTAWERVRYFDRPDSRDWVGLKVFAANRDYNLGVMKRLLMQNTFEPSFPEIRFIPKSSPTLRPMAVLTTSDRIIYQAIANVIAERGRSLLSLVENRQSFGNVLNNLNKIEMFRPWKEQYFRFEEKFILFISEGNRWLAETDIAAFYDTIDHSLLFDILIKNDFIDEQVLEYLKTYLPVWASIEYGKRVTRGLPQGCLASDLLANVYLIGFDQDIAALDFHYLRYVDDIRILAKDRECVQRGLIRVDRNFKSLGLILQTKKTSIREIDDISSETERLASHLSQLDRKISITRKLNDTICIPTLREVVLQGDEFGSYTCEKEIAATAHDELSDLFWRTKERIDSGNSDVFADRHLKFCLYRLKEDNNIAQALISYLTERPWLSEDIFSYLQKCDLSEDIIIELFELIRTHNVYDSIVASAIETLVNKGIPLGQFHHMFKQWLNDDKRDWPLLCACAIALGDSEDNIMVLRKNLQSSKSPAVRRMCMIQALRQARNEGEAIDILKLRLDDNSPIMIDMLLYVLYNEWGLTLHQLKTKYHGPFSDYCIAQARGYDDSLPEIQPCYIRHVFQTDYKVKFYEKFDFQNLLGVEYKRATDFLYQARGSYLVNPSRYVSQLDLFHEELLYPILVDVVKWKATKTELAKVAFPDRMVYLQKNVEGLGVLGSTMLTCHKLRSSCTEAHTRLQGVLEFTSPINWRQRDSLRKKLKGAYQELVDWLLKNT